MKFTITRGGFDQTDLSNISPDQFFKPQEGEKILFDLEDFLISSQNKIKEISENIKKIEIDPLFKEKIVGLKSYIQNYMTQNKIDKKFIINEFDVISKNIKSQDILLILKNLNNDIKNGLDEVINIGSIPFKKIYILMYLYASMMVSQLNFGNTKIIKNNDHNIVHAEIKKDTGEKIIKEFAGNKIKPQITIGTVELPSIPKATEETNKKTGKKYKKINSVFVPNEAVSIIDNKGNVNNIILKGVEKLPSGTTACAKGGREKAEEIYNMKGENFIVKEEYDGDHDAIGYNKIAETGKLNNGKDIKDKYKYFDHYEEINKINEDKDFVDREISYDISGFNLEEDKFAMLTTTQSNLKTKDGHAVFVINMYNTDGSFNGIYVSDSYLMNSIHKTLKNKSILLSNKEIESYSSIASGGSFIPISIYIEYCKIKNRAPIGFQVYNVPEGEKGKKLIAKKNISPDIDIQQANLKQFQDIYIQVNEYIKKNKELIGEDFLETSYIEDLANFAKESKLSPFARNSSGFTGIGQMNNKSLKAVYENYSFIINDFNNKDKIEELNVNEMIIAAKLYKNGVIYKEVKDLGIFDKINPDNKKEFILAAYNRGATGLNKIINRYIDETGITNNIKRDDMEDYFIDQIAEGKIGSKKKPGYIEIFGENHENEEEYKIGYVDDILILENELRDFINKNREDNDSILNLDSLIKTNNSLLAAE